MSTGTVLAVGSPAWHKRQIEDYKRELPIYKEFAKALGEMLGAAAKLHAPEAIVQARAKTLSSFAEKALRKARAKDAEGNDPVHKLTDLCGSRVIVHTASEVEAVCEWIRSTFEVDEPNSQDTSVRLKTPEFGYRSVHFIVQFRDDGAKILDVEVPARVGKRRAEIQVRTIAQHAWADTTHDRLYKGAFKPPEVFKRDAARIAALLEQADQEFSALVKRIDSYQLDFGAYMDTASMDAEIETLETILLNESDQSKHPELRLRIARVACAAGNWEKVVDALQHVANCGGPLHDEILERLGQALCQVDRSRGVSFDQGQKYLKEVGKPDGPVSPRVNLVRARALAHMAWNCRTQHGEGQQTHDLYALAFQCNFEDPFHLQHFLEARFTINPESLGSLQVLRPAIRSAIARCRSYIEVKIELPWSWLAIARFHLFLEEPYLALAAYAKAVALAHGANQLESHLHVTRRLADVLSKQLPALAWVIEFLELSQVALNRKGEPPASTPTGAPQHVLIIAGGTSAEAEPEIASRESALRNALAGFRGVVFCGGTTAGIAGRVGAITKDLTSAGDCGYELKAYLPNPLPSGATQDASYSVTPVGKEQFSPLQPLRQWADLLRLGINPKTVLVLGVNGGDIAGFEYRLAAALGATVAVVQKSRGEADALLNDPDWQTASNILALPDDSATILGFVQSRSVDTNLTQAQIESAGKQVHEFYRKGRQGEIAKSNLLEWDELHEDFKHSNREQARYAEFILRRCKFDVHPLSSSSDQAGVEAAAKFEFKESEVEEMAELEHGRWNAERLQAGWRFAEKDAKEQKLSHCLVPWLDLSKEIQEYDRQAVRRFPEILAQAGFKIVRR